MRVIKFNYLPRTFFQDSEKDCPEPVVLDQEM